MNTRQMIAMLQEDYYTVGVQFKRGSQLSLKDYTYKVPRKITLQLKDEVVVFTPIDGAAMAIVTRIDDRPVLDLEGSKSYKWIVQKVDFSEYNKKTQTEKALFDLFSRYQYTKQRQDLHADVLNTLGEVDRYEFLGILEALKSMNTV